MSQRYTEEQQAAALARWLDQPDAPLPPELDPEVAGAVYALSPDRAPRAPELDLDALLDGIAEGPFAARPAGGEPARPEPATAEPVQAERRPDQRRAQAVASAGARAPEPRRLLPRRMIPAAGLLAAAALAAVLVIPMATRLGVTESNPDVLNAPMPQMASAAPSPVERAGDAGEGASPVGAIPEASAPASAPAASAPAASAPAASAPAASASADMSAKSGLAAGAVPSVPGGAAAFAPTAAPAPAAPVATGSAGGGVFSDDAIRTANSGPVPMEAADVQAVREADAQAGVQAGGGEDEDAGVASRTREPAAERARGDAVIAEARAPEGEAKPKASWAERAAPQAMAPPPPPPAMAAPAMVAPSQPAGGGAAVWPMDYAEGWYTRYPDVVAAYEAALALERARSWSAAGEAWRRLMADERNSVAQDAAFRAARAWWQAGQAATALRLIEEGLRRSTANTAFRARLYALKADVLIAEGRAQEAEAARQQAILLNGAR